MTPAGLESPITEELVAALARVVGLDLPAERLQLVTARLRELHEIAALLDTVDLGELPPAAAFEPSWPEAAP